MQELEKTPTVGDQQGPAVPENLTNEPGPVGPPVKEEKAAQPAESAQKQQEQRIWAIAQVCYDAERSFRQINGDNSLNPWDYAEGSQKRKAAQTVQAILLTEGASADQVHELWMLQMLANGWNFGPKENETAKTHPFLVPFHQLPEDQQHLTRLTVGIVNSLAAAPASPQTEEQINQMWRQVISDARWHNGEFGEDRRERLVDHFKGQYNIQRK